MPTLTKKKKINNNKHQKKIVQEKIQKNSLTLI